MILKYASTSSHLFLQKRKGEESNPFATALTTTKFGEGLVV